MATFEKRGKKWRFKILYYDDNHNRKYYTKSGFQTKTEAKAAATEIEYQIKKNDISLSNQDISFYDYYKNWVKVYKKPNVGKSSMNRFNNIGDEVINNYFHNTKIRNISRIDYQNFMNEYSKTRSKLTIEKTNSIIRSCVENAIDDGIITRDFTKNVTLNGAPSRKRSAKFLTIEQFKNLINYANQNKGLQSISYYMILTGAYTGMRYEEIAGLTWPKINFNTKTIKVDQIYDYVDTKKIVSRTKTESSKRTIPLLDPLKAILEQLHTAQLEWLVASGKRNSQQIVFLNNDMAIPSNAGCSKSLIYIQDQIEVPRKKQIRMHGLRHTFASYLLAQGMQIKYVSEFLGHKNSNITMRAYEHLLKEQKEKSNNKANEILKRLS